MLTFCAVFKDEALTIRPVLNLARDLGLPMCIVVQESQDGTLQIVQEYTGNIIMHPAQSPEESKDEVMDRVNSDWTFWLDADEYPSTGMINFVRDFNPNQFPTNDSFKFPRINYIDGYHIEANQGKDEQFRILKSSIRWYPKEQGRRIHIHPKVINPWLAPFPLYHYRDIEKIERQTARWNELEPKTAEACNQYLAKVKEELWKAKQK